MDSGELRVTLSPEQQQFVEKAVASGDYPSAAAVVAAGLRALQQEDEAYWEDVRAKVAHGQAQVARGEVVDGHTALESIMRRLRDKYGDQEALKQAAS